MPHNRFPDGPAPGPVKVDGIQGHQEHFLESHFEGLILDDSAEGLAAPLTSVPREYEDAAEPRREMYVAFEVMGP